MLIRFCAIGHLPLRSPVQFEPGWTPEGVKICLQLQAREYLMCE
jgi:hypothetical protein